MVLYFSPAGLKRRRGSENGFFPTKMFHWILTVYTDDCKRPERSFPKLKKFLKRGGETMGSQNGNVTGIA